MIVWTDLETTGIDPADNVILEVAVVVTDDHLNEIGMFCSLVSPGHDPNLFNTGDYICWEGHKENGLIDRLCLDYAEGGLPHRTPREVAGSICTFFDRLGLPTEDKPPLAGSTISFDRGFLGHHMPEVLSHLHYRNIDVSTIRELAHRWRPDLKESEKKGAHRALADIRESIALLKFYREVKFVG